VILIEAEDSACDERMGMIAGGKIMQTIYQDTRNCMLYDDDSSEQVYIHTVSSRAWEVRRLTFK
jgi:hypothetical protein